ncbi:MAG: inositol monophosphatase family protein [Brevinemataceae bacterium]
MDYNQYLSTALELAKNIAPIFREGFFRDNDVEWKTESDPVTEYDRRIEELTQTYILSKYPEHLILGEEYGLCKDMQTDFQWIVDPIDGTINYIRGIPFTAYSLALMYQNEVIVAVIYNPIIDEFFWATKDNGAFLNGKKIHISSCNKLKKGYLSMGAYKKRYFSYFERLVPAFQSVRSTGSAALALAYVAAGRIDAALYFHLAPWDMAAGFLLIKEAGGIATNIGSTSFSIKEPSILAANSYIYSYISNELSSLELDIE